MDILNSMKKILLKFINCGILGWCIEIIFTSLDSLRKKDFKLMGNTSIWMFPIYGSFCLLSPLLCIFKKMHWFIRGFLYTILIFTGEYVAGKWLNKKNMCPWDYSCSKWNIDRIIRLDYAPLWFLLGLLFERLLSHKDASLSQDKK